MKTTFSRTFFTTVVILLLALTLVGTSFQALVRNFLTDSAISELQNNSTAISQLASAYYAEDAVLNRDFLVNLDIASQISGADAVICNASGRVVLCSSSLTGCDHQGLRVDPGYMEKVVSNGGDVATGIIKGLYDEVRYVVSSPITDAFTGENLGIVIVSKPTAATENVMTNISDIFVMVSFTVILVSECQPA